MTLRFCGGELLPDEITVLPGAIPSVSPHKGQQLTGSQSGTPRAARLGERGIELGPNIYEADEEVGNAQRQQAIN